VSRKVKKALTRYQKTAFGVWGASAVLFGAGLFLFYLPQREAMGQVEQRCKELSGQAAAAEQAASAAARGQLEERAEQVLEKLGAFTVGSDQVSRLVFEIGRIAESLRLQGYASKYLESPVRTEKSTEALLLSEAWLSVEFSGSYEQFARFVNQLERHRPAIFVETVSVTRGSSAAESCKFQMELSIVTTVDKSAEPAAKAGTEKDSND